MKKFFLFLFLMAGVGGGGYWWWLQQQKPTEPAKPIVARLDQGEVIEKVSATGKVAPREKVLVSSDVPFGIAVQVNPDAEQGKFISQGTWLIKLDDKRPVAGLKEAEAALDTARAARQAAEATKKKAQVGVEVANLRLTAARSEFDRQVKLVQENAPPGKIKAFEDQLKEAAEGVNYAETQVAEAEAGIKTAEANVKRAEAGVALAKVAVDMMTLVAPRDGLILEKRVLVGQPITPQNSPLFILTPTPNDWEIYALVSEQDIARVVEGQAVEFTVDAYNSKNIKFKGRILKKDRVPTQLPNAGGFGLGLTGPTNYGVTISVIHDPQLDSQFPLLAGMTANVDVQVNQAKDALRVPNTALQYRPANLPREVQEEIDKKAQQGWQPIWVYSGGIAGQMRYVKTGVNDGTYTEIKEVEAGTGAPLKPGTEVVIEDPLPEKPAGLGLFGDEKPLDIPIR